MSAFLRTSVFGHAPDSFFADLDLETENSELQKYIISKKIKIIKNSFLLKKSKVLNFPFFFTVLKVVSHHFDSSNPDLQGCTYFKDSLVGSVLFMSISIHAFGEHDVINRSTEGLCNCHTKL